MIKAYVYFVCVFIAITVNAQSCPDNNHPHAIDLGLSSGTKWSCCNIESKNPQDIGNYYSWGETEDKELYSKKNYDGSLGPFYSRVIHLNGGNHDVAHVVWGSPWQMPSLEQVNELINECSHQWSVVGGVNGMVFTGKNNNSIFLPAGGKRIDFSLNSKDSYGFYWSDTEYDRSTAYYIYFYDGNLGTSRGGMYIGHLVRPVQSENND